MHTSVVLLRGINVGGKNKVPMADLKQCLKILGFSNVSTYIASGNVILESEQQPDVIKGLIEQALPKCFIIDDELIKVLMLSRDQFRAIIHNKPEGFGEQQDKFHSDAIFLIDIGIEQAMSVFDPREGVDRIWPGTGMIYSQRLSSQLTKSRLSKIIGTPEYKCMTIRSWNTVIKLMALLNQRV
jgi:uncharacterized protein (DUF1697 family)